MKIPTIPKFARIAVVLVLATLSARTQQICPIGPPTGTGQACVKPLSGCVCVANVMSTVGSFPDCGGCFYSASGSLDCTYAHGPGTSSPISQSGEIPCGQRAGLSLGCPCVAGSVYTPAVYVCGECGS